LLNRDGHSSLTVTRSSPVAADVTCDTRPPRIPFAIDGSRSPLTRRRRT
jgi:hypothetical protein